MKDNISIGAAATSIIFDELKKQGKTLIWLSEQTGISLSTLEKQKRRNGLLSFKSWVYACKVLNIDMNIFKDLYLQDDRALQNGVAVELKDGHKTLGTIDNNIGMTKNLSYYWIKTETEAFQVHVSEFEVIEGDNNDSL